MPDKLHTQSRADILGSDRHEGSGALVFVTRMQSSLPQRGFGKLGQYISELLLPASTFEGNHEGSVYKFARV